MRETFTSVLIFGVTFAGMSVSANAAKCDRACLEKTVDSYIAAMVAHDPSQVAFAKDVKFVENTVPMKPGEGLWKTASEAPSDIQDLCSRSGGGASGLPVRNEGARQGRRQAHPVGPAPQA